MGSTCTKSVIDVIPDRDTMIEVVETIVAFEDALKKGSKLSKQETREMARVQSVSKEMKRLVRVQKE